MLPYHNPVYSVPSEEEGGGLLSDRTSVSVQSGIGMAVWVPGGAQRSEESWEPLRRGLW